MPFRQRTANEEPAPRSPPAPFDDDNDSTEYCDFCANPDRYDYHRHHSPDDDDECDQSGKSDSSGTRSSRSCSPEGHQRSDDSDPSPKQAHKWRLVSEPRNMKRTCSWDTCPDNGKERVQGIYVCENKNCRRHLCLKYKGKPEAEAQRKCGRQ